MLTPRRQISVTLVGYPPSSVLIEHLAKRIGRTVPVWVSCRESYAFWCEHQNASAVDIRDGGRVTEIKTPCVLVDPSQGAFDEVIRNADDDIEVYVFDERLPLTVPPSVQVERRQLCHQ